MVILCDIIVWSWKCLEGDKGHLLWVHSCVIHLYLLETMILRECSTRVTEI